MNATDLGESTDGRDRAAAALTMITSTVSDLRAADWRPWHARSRKRRLLVQPLTELPEGTIVIAPNFCYAATSVYLRYFQQDMLPWSQPQPPGPVNRALASIRDQRNKALEDDVAALLTGAGYSTLTRVKETAPRRIGVPMLSGEIDVLAGQRGSRTIWLLEVKDPADIFVTPEVRRHLDTFYADHGKPAYLTQLQRKHADLTAYGAQVATRLQPPLPDGDYTVRPLFVTRRPVPAAFAGGPVPFVAITDLLDYLDGHSNP
jgi:hypothetical protein